MAHPSLTYLTTSSSFNDYRPTMNAAGDTVIFERTPATDHGAPTTLQMIDDLGSPNPVPFLSGSSLPASQTRPDWCWATGDVLFNGATSNSAPVSVWRVGSNGVNPTPIDGTTDAFYPKWGLEGTEFVTENSSPAAAPKPCNTVFNLKGIPIAWNINGKIPAGWIPTFGGMPAVMASGLFNICYAGEPAIPDWNGPNTGIKYNENNNYIFLNKQAKRHHHHADGGGRLGLRVRSQLRGAGARRLTRRHNDRLRVQSFERRQHLHDLPVQAEGRVGEAGDQVRPELPACQVFSLRHQADPRRPESDLEHRLGGHFQPAGLTLL